MATNVRKQIVPALRAVVAAIDGIDVTRIAAQNTIDNDTAWRPNPTWDHFYIESVDFGEAIDTAKDGSGPYKRWRRVDGFYQLAVMTQVGGQITPSGELAGAIEDAFITTPIQLASGWPVTITDVSIRPGFPDSSLSNWWKTPVVVRYFFIYYHS